MRPVALLAILLASLALPASIGASVPLFSAPVPLFVTNFAEPSLAMDPTDPDRIYVITPSTRSLVWRSDDGGSSFARVASTLGRGGDSDVVVAPDGTLLAADLRDASGAFTVPVSISTDHAASFGAVVTVAPVPGQDRHWLAMGPEGALYVKWWGPASGGANFGISRDNGHTYELKSGAPSFSGPLVAAADGALYLASVGAEEVSFVLNPDVVVHKSVDEGTTWTEHLAAPYTAHWGSNIGVPQGFPNVAADGSGHVYVAWTDYEGTAYAKSADGGLTWSPRIPLSSAFHGLVGTFGVFPWVVASEGGGVAIAYYESDDALPPDAKLAGLTTWRLIVVHDPAPWDDAESSTRIDLGPMHFGSLCTQASACPNERVGGDLEFLVGGPPGDRRLGDFFEMAILGDGQLAIAYARDVTEGPDAGKAEIVFQRQVDGPRLP